MCCRTACSSCVTLWDTIARHTALCPRCDGMFCRGMRLALLTFFVTVAIAALVQIESHHWAALGARLALIGSSFTYAFFTQLPRYWDMLASLVMAPALALVDGVRALLPTAANVAEPVRPVPAAPPAALGWRAKNGL